MARCLINFFRSATSVGGILTSVSFCGSNSSLGPRTHRSHVDYHMAMPRLFAFYLPRVLVPDRRKIEDTVKKAIQ